MAIRTAQVTVTTTATLLSSTAASAIGSRVTPISVRNTHATADLFIGKSDVTTTTGYAIPAGQSIPIDLEAGEDLYGIVASGTLVAHVLEVRV